MPLEKSHLDKIVLQSIDRFINFKFSKNIYFYTKNLSGAGKSSLLKRIKSYCAINNLPHCYIKNLCSLDAGIKVTNRSEENLRIILKSIPSTPQILLCDEVKETELYFKLRDKHHFIYTGYALADDIGDFENEFNLLQIDTQFTKKEMKKILNDKYPNKQKLIKKVMEISPNLGLGERCLVALGESLNLNDLEEYCQKLNNPSRGASENYNHYLEFESNSENKRKSFSILL